MFVNLEGEFLGWGILGTGSLAYCGFHIWDEHHFSAGH